MTCHCWPDEHLSWSGLVSNPIMLLEAREDAEFTQELLKSFCFCLNQPLSAALEGLLTAIEAVEAA